MGFLRSVSIGTKVFGVLLPCVLLSIAVVAYLSIKVSQEALEKEAFNRLIAVREIKAKFVEDYFSKIRSQVETFSENRMTVEAMRDFKRSFKTLPQEINLDEQSQNEAKDRLSRYYKDRFLPKLSVNLGRSTNFDSYFPSDPSVLIAQDLYISMNSYPLGSKHLLDASDDSSRYSAFHAKYHPIFRNYLEKFGYYDIFLIDAETGKIIYSVFKEADFATSLINGPYANSNFAEVFRQARDSGSKNFVKLIDFKPYEPSYNAPASFIASPIFDGDELIGVAAFQMPIDKINSIMTSGEKWEDIGLGKTGETYIVGADYTVKSEPRFLLEDKFAYLELLESLGTSEVVRSHILSTGSAIGIQRIETQASKRAIAGEKGSDILPDYRGVEVLSSFKQLNIGDMNWAVLSEIDKAEAFAPILKMERFVAISAVVAIGAIGLIILLFTRSVITRPLNQMLSAINDLRKGDGDLTFRLPNFGRDEIGQTASSLNDFIERLQTVMRDIKLAVKDLDSASGEVNATAKTFRENSVTQAVSIEETSAALTEMSVSISQNAQNAQSTNTLATSSSTRTADGGKAVERTVAAMKDIAGRVNMIEDFAYKTDLLALNAMIEAARFGDAGEGFAVVADSVGNLAELSQVEAKEISELARSSVKIAEEAGFIMQGTVPDIQETAKLVQEISIASQEQAQGVAEITSAVKQLDKTASEGRAASEALEETSEGMRTLVKRIHEQVGFFKID